MSIRRITRDIGYRTLKPFTSIVMNFRILEIVIPGQKYRDQFCILIFSQFLVKILTELVVNSVDSK